MKIMREGEWIIPGGIGNRSMMTRGGAKIAFEK